MPELEETLDRIAAARAEDPLAIVTIIAPSRLSTLQLRRRLAARGAFAGVRFETAARLAELVASQALARQGKKPLARPIADYVATRIARDSRQPLDSVSSISGYARALRHTFRRLRSGGFRDEADVRAAGGDAGIMPEIARLFGRFRAETAAFYDEEDLLETAAEEIRRSPDTVLPELGAVVVVPPSRLTAAAADFLDAIRLLSRSYEEVDEPSGSAGPADQRFILAPDAASEARGLVRAVVGDLEDGVKLDRIAVFTSGDRSYRALLRQAFETAMIPDASMPGTPLIELPAGRGALALAKMALEEYSRVEMFDFLALSPLRREIDIGGTPIPMRVSHWQRLAREAGITRGARRWREGLGQLIDDRNDALKAPEAPQDWRAEANRRDIEAAENLGRVVESLIAVLEPLRNRQPAREFIPPFRKLLESWLQPAAEGMQEVLNEVDQLGTIDAVGGTFDIRSFVEAFEANLGLASIRRRSLDRGVLIADHRQAAGLRFDRVYLAGAYEGALPAIATAEPLLQDEDWRRLRQSHPFIEDLALRSQRSKEAVGRVAAAAQGRLTWSTPVAEATAARELYPSPLMTDAVRRRDVTISTAAALRRAAPREWLTRLRSPISALLIGAPVETWDLRLRETVSMKKSGAFDLPPRHGLEPAVSLIRSRFSDRFSEYDGNISALKGLLGPQAGDNLSPSALEAMGQCGMRFFFGRVLRLRPVDEPEDNQTMGAAERGTLVHEVLHRFFKEQLENGRPRLEEEWNKRDERRLLEIFDEEFQRLLRQGRTGLDMYAGHGRRALEADLRRFLAKDSEYRLKCGVRPHEFELSLQPTPVGDVRLYGRVDRIDRSPDGKKAVVLDYKTGKADDYEGISGPDPFKGGALMQMPVYVHAAANADEVIPAYWFISSRGEFKLLPYPNSPENQQRFRETLDAMVSAMRGGAYPAIPGAENEFYRSHENCRYCDFDRICTVRRSYEAEGKAADPALRPWGNIGRVARGEAGL